MLISTKVLQVNELLMNNFMVGGSGVLTFEEGSHVGHIHTITVTHYIRAVFCDDYMSLSKMK